MAYEVTAAEDAPEGRLVVSVANTTLVFGEALDQDREDETVHVVSGDALVGDANLASELALISERVPEVAAAVKVEYIDDTPEPELEDEEVLEVHPVDPPDTVVPAGETTPGLERIEDTDVFDEDDPGHPGESSKRRGPAEDGE
jgi:hypothetical protein